MKLKNRLKRLTDILEKPGVARLAIGLFQSRQTGPWLGIGFIVMPIFLTEEGT